MKNNFKILPEAYAVFAVTVLAVMILAAGCSNPAGGSPEVSGLAGTVDATAFPGFTAETVWAYAEASCSAPVSNAAVRGGAWTMTGPENSDALWFRVELRKDSGSGTCFSEVFPADNIPAGGRDGIALTVAGFIITFKQNYGEDLILTAKSALKGASLDAGMPQDPRRTGYAFRGWNTKPDGSGETFNAWTVAEGNTTVYAQWQEGDRVLFTLTYDPNGGVGTVPSETAQTVILDDGKDLNRDGYTFKGWNTAEDCRGGFYAPGSAFTSDSPAATLYAVWSGNGSDADHAEVITNRAELAGVAAGLTHYYVLAADITITGEWTPLGNASLPFNGTLDGGGHRITWDTQNVVLQPVVVNDGHYGAGIFGLLGNSGAVKNLFVSGKLEYADVSGGNFYLAHIVSYNAGTIESCGVSGNATLSKSTGDSAYGGSIAGRNTNGGVIRNCFTRGNVTVTGNAKAYSGGIAGSSSASITYCYGAGNVSAQGSSSYTGGISGVNLNAAAMISHCVSLAANLTGKASGVTRISAIFFGSGLFSNYGNRTALKNSADEVWQKNEASKENGADVDSGTTRSEIWWTSTAGWASVWASAWGGSEAAPWQWDAVNSRPRLRYEPQD